MSAPPVRGSGGADRPAGVLVVGAGVAGLRTAEALRARGWTGPITVVGAEPEPPYYRPAVSEQVLTAPASDPQAGPPGGTGAHPGDGLALAIAPAIEDVDFVLGDAVVAADLAKCTASTAAGRRLSWDGLVIATGLVPARLSVPGPPPDAAHGRYVLRTLADGRALAAALRPGRQVVIVGTGFVGCEAAVAARAAGCAVTCTALESEPLAGVLGLEVGAALRRRHEAAGIAFRLGVPVTGLEGTDQVTAVVLADGTRLAADVVLEAVGSRPATDWLAGSGLDLVDGVRADGHLRALDTAGSPVGGVVVAGDLARYPNARLDPVPRRVEHWTNATDTARVAGASLAAWLAGAEPTATATPLPSFWSDQGSLRLQAFGWPGPGMRTVLLEGTLADEAVVGYVAPDDRLVGLLGLGLLDRLLARRADIGRPAS